MSKIKKTIFWGIFFVIHTANIFCQPIDTASCKNYQRSLDGIAKTQAAYDLGKAFVEHCAGWGPEIYEFSDLSEYNYYRSSDPCRFKEFIEWLKNVLYLTNDSNFYCSDVFTIVRQLSKDNCGIEFNWKGQITVMKYMVDSKKCLMDSLYFDSLLIPNTWQYGYSSWLDTVVNPLKTPFDSTLPSLEDLGLGILLGKSDVQQLTNNEIFVIAVSQNPFSDQVSLQIEINVPTFLTIEIYDVIGKKFDLIKKYIDKGNSTWIIYAHDLPKGLLYLRVSTLNNQVKTVKLIHK